MCLVIQDVYMDCEHKKSQQLVEACIHEHTPHAVRVMHYRTIHSPSFCPPCFRGLEDDIVKEHQAMMQQPKHIISRRLAQIDQLRDQCLITADGEEEGEWSKIDEYNDEINRCENYIQGIKRKQQAEIRKFRDEQGVWADG